MATARAIQLSRISLPRTEPLEAGAVLTFAVPPAGEARQGQPRKNHKGSSYFERAEVFAE